MSYRIIMGMTIYHRKIEHPIIEENYEHQPSVSNWLYLSVSAPYKTPQKNSINTKFSEFKIN